MNGQVLSALWPFADSFLTLSLPREEGRREKRKKGEENTRKKKGS
jgi:hypothetical protein